MPAPPQLRRAIRQLPEEVAARIAAGEVIERPASVVKELVENALDAGARAIRIDVQGGGLALIRVSDDGCGIPPGELWLACQRHATSKLPGDDLTAVRTLGFRGEALPSIAAVAELTIVSADDGSGIGRRIVLRDGRVISEAPAARTQGTTVTVRYLFANLPARLAAVERPQAESAQIGQTVRRLALTAPHVRFTLSIENRLAVQTSGSGDLATTMVEVYSPALTGSLIPLGPATVGSARLSGLVAGAEVTRPGRGHINVIVNGRWTQPRGLLALLEGAYRPLLPRGRHPIATLWIEVPPERVDINVHPAKLEVRLLDERLIGQALGDLLREALGRRPIPLTALALTGTDALSLPVLARETPAVYDDGPIITPALPPLRLIGQVQRRLLLLEGDAGLYLIDQHRAHERVLYEHLTAVHGPGAPEPLPLRCAMRLPSAPPLPEPIVFEVRPGQLVRLSARLEELAALGFTCEAFGGRAFLLRAAPSLPGVLAGDGADDLAGIGERDALVTAL
ncbi:MAG: DNA mismatch repair protein MutL, partial [Chloroflexota bacterium]